MTADADKLRSRAIELWNQHADSDLLELRAELEEDTEMWARLWAPACALAAGRLGDDQTAWDLLTAAVAGGFCQPDVCEGELEAVFAEDPRWPGLLARMRANVPPALIELLSWPSPTQTYGLDLFRLPTEPEERLRQRIPMPSGTARETAKALLAWVARAWQHDGIQHAGDDAHEILDRVEAGDRFACVEYSTLLSQALNAVRIPARRVALRTADHHTGYGRGHVVSEAWIDELRRWVVLDGQNGAIWSAPESRGPLGLVELLNRQRTGAQRPRFIGLTREHPDSAAEQWWRYFDTATVEGVRDGATIGATWAPAPYTPVFQDHHWLGADLLTTDLTALYPDLSGVRLGLCGSLVDPALRLTPFHPYAREIELRTNGWSDRTPIQPGPAGLPTATIPLPTNPGRHDLEIVIHTPYAALHAGQVMYRVRDTASDSGPTGGPGSSRG